MHYWSPLDQSATGAYWLGRAAAEHGESCANPFKKHNDAEMPRQWKEGYDDGWREMKMLPNDQAQPACARRWAEINHQRPTRGVGLEQIVMRHEFSATENDYQRLYDRKTPCELREYVLAGFSEESAMKFLDAGLSPENATFLFSVPLSAEDCKRLFAYAPHQPRAIRASDGCQG